MKRVHYVLLMLGLVWLAFDVYLVISDITLRATTLHVVAEWLDKLPVKIGTPIFLLLWAILLLGWTVPLGLSLRQLVRRKQTG